MLMKLESKVLLYAAVDENTPTLYVNYCRVLSTVHV